MVEDYAHEYHMRHPEREIELLSLDTKEGWEMAKLYAVVRYPAVLVIAEDGHMQQLFENEQLPLMSEVDAYFASSEPSNVEKPDEL